MLKTQTNKSEVQRIIDKYGEGFDVIYFDGKADGIIENKFEVARNLLKEGVEEEFISRNTGLSLDQIKNIKRKL
ncbi:hypothetical protein [uncultured Methanobrevibacter sp.]|uniref:hypothetical protein n=1 Tax=uncultured Methanobrevibacter sp. TaxID=253161 RepID=UPI0025DC5C4E|nr:hypothetical protein [uncultured Methanobrevibacter sp.]